MDNSIGTLEYRFPIHVCADVAHNDGLDIRRQDGRLRHVANHGANVSIAASQRAHQMLPDEPRGSGHNDRHRLPVNGRIASPARLPDTYPRTTSMSCVYRSRLKARAAMDYPQT